LEKLHQDIVLSAKYVANSMTYNMGRGVGETEEHLLHHVLHGDAFPHCAKWLVISIQDVILCKPAFSTLTSFVKETVPLIPREMETETGIDVYIDKKKEKR
jgi:hypothetical protein